MPSRPGLPRSPRRTRAGDIAGYAVAVVILVGGGALFTRNILTWTRGPYFAVAAIVLIGWAVDRLVARRRGSADDGDGDGDGANANDGPEGEQ